MALQQITFLGNDLKAKKAPNLIRSLLSVPRAGIEPA